jgi:S1-C subfamily serine protease
MSDRAVYPAIVEKVNREHDLGLIRVKANDLVTAKWTQSEQITVGALVAAILPSNELRVGIVSQSARAIPAERGFMGGLRDGDRGLELYDDTTLRAYNLPLHKNDVILRVEDRPTPDLKTYQQLMEADDRAPLAVTGDPVSVDIQRGSEMLHLQFPLGPMNWPRPWGETESRRFSGFPGVLDTDLPLATTQCGAPLVDSTGGTAAIVIACRTRGRTHIIPAAVARAFISD